MTVGNAPSYNPLGPGSPDKRASVNIHEYQAKALLAKRGVPAPAGRVAASPERAAAVFGELGAARAAVKAQVHAGGRGKAGGIAIVESAEEAHEAARRLIGSTLVTHQTGPQGRPVRKVLVEEGLDLESELYLSVSLDRDTGDPLVVASARGGVEIEELAGTEPSAIVRERGDAVHGVRPYQARKVFAGLGLPRRLLRPTAALVQALGETFVACDCSLIELNPLGVTADGRLVAADVKMSFDDNALLRHPEIADLRDPSQEDPREVAAAQHDLSYVGLRGNIGCMVNGAGLAMATMDLIRLHGGEPANFLDVGGNATVEKVVAAFRIILEDAAVRAILVNIFGGIVRCDLVADGVIEAVREVGLTVPLVVRLEGTRADEGRKRLAESDLKIIPAPSLEEAAVKAVELSG